MKRVAIALGLLGLAVAIALVARAGLRSVMDAVALAGWPLLWLVPLRLVPIALDAVAWRVLLAPRDEGGLASWPVLVAVASVREAVNRLLPVAGVGGELVGIRIVIRRGVPAAATAASVIAEVVLTLLNLVLFAALGLALLLARARGGTSLDAMLIGLLLALPLPLGGLWLISEGRLIGWLERFSSLVTGRGGARPAWLESMSAFKAELSALARRRGRLVLATLWQLAGMVAGASEVWLALRLLGHPVGVSTSVIIESVVLFARNVAFAVPAGLGAQEAAIVVICAAVGLDQDLAIGLALAKRMREVLFGVPALVGWHLWESFGGAPLLDARSASRSRE
jgi:putative membrane protein